MEQGIYDLQGLARRWWWRVVGWWGPWGMGWPWFWRWVCHRSWRDLFFWECACPWVQPLWGDLQRWWVWRCPCKLCGCKEPAGQNAHFQRLLPRCGHRPKSTTWWWHGWQSQKKNKGKTVSRKGKAPSKGQSNPPRNELLGENVYLKCGQSGHQTCNCPAVGDRKRKADKPDNDDVMLVVLGVNANKEVEVFKWEKGLKYPRRRSRICALFFPTYRKRKILCFVIGGIAPIFIGRPLMLEFGLVVAYDHNMIRYRGGKWQQTELGPKGEFIVRLAVDHEDFKNNEDE